MHLCGTADWAAALADGAIDPGGAFVHLSTPEQVHLPANRLFRGRTDLVLLHVDPALLDSAVRWEPGVPADPEAMRFPHLYGPLPVRAVIGVTAYRPTAEGTFAPVGAPHDAT